MAKQENRQKSAVSGEWHPRVMSQGEHTRQRHIADRREKVRGGLSVRAYAKKLAERNREEGLRPIRNLKSCAAKGLSFRECPRMDVHKHIHKADKAGK